MHINGDVNERIALLVTEIQNGNERAFDELYKLTSQRAYYVALEFVKNEDIVQDILQESYIKALSKIKELGKPESFQSWLNQIVANKSKDFLKKKKPMLFEAEENEVYEALPDEDTSFSPEENLDQNELQRTVMEVLDELNEEKRACVLMMYFEELSVSEIAETLEIPEGTVKTRLFSARKDLKEKFSKRGITSAYSVAPIGIVLWAMRRTSITAGATFAASSGSSTVLAGITASGVLAASGATAATVAGTGIAAKIAALTVAQKAIAGVSVAAVVIGGTVGVATVADKNGGNAQTTTAYTEEFTTAPYDGTTIAFQAVDGTVEFTLTDTLATNAETASSNEQTAATQAGTAAATKPVSTTKPASTTKSVSTTKPASTTKSVSTTRQTTTKPTTAKPTTTKPTTAKPTSTKASTTKPTTTKSPTTNGSATIEIKVIDLDGKEIDKLSYTIDAGTKMTSSYLWTLVESEGYTVTGVFGDAKGNTAQAGKTYTFEAEI